MALVGRIKELSRYPVKGLAGECVVENRIDALGLVGDRTWAVRETSRREIQSCKRHPKLLSCSARYVSEPERGGPNAVVIRFPDGNGMTSNDPGVHERLSQLCGVDVTLEPLRPASDTEFYRRYNSGGDGWLRDLVATFAREPGEPLPDFSHLPPAAIEFVAAPGSFALVAPLHIVTTASLRQLAQWNPAADWDVRRFRPNVVIESAPGVEGLAEQAWIGRRVRLGDAGLECVGATPRCGAITRAQDELAFDAGMLRTVVRQADQNVGVYCTISNPGMLRIGDALTVA